MAQTLKWRSRLKKALDDSGRTKREVSKAAGLGPNYLREILADSKEPRPSKLALIAAQLDVSMSDLMGDMMDGAA